MIPCLQGDGVYQEGTMEGAGVPRPLPGLEAVLSANSVLNTSTSALVMETNLSPHTWMLSF